MKIAQEIVDYVSALSRLSLPELEKILQYMDVLEGLDTAGVEPMSHVIPLENIMREDRVMPSQDRGELLAGAPVPDQEAFLTPKSVE